MCEIMEELRRDSILEGIQKGIKEGIRKKQIETAQNMLAEGTFVLDLIAKVTKLTIEEVQALAEGKQI